jgi:hypothetical protein
MAEKTPLFCAEFGATCTSPRSTFCLASRSLKAFFWRPTMLLGKWSRSFKYVLLSVEEERTLTDKKTPARSGRLYFRFEGTAFRQEARHYAAYLFQKTCFSDKRAELLAAAKTVRSERRLPPSQRRTGTTSQSRMIREVLLKRGGPLLASKIAEEIRNRFNVKLKRADIAGDAR